MNNSLKWLINDIIEYATEGNDIIVKTPSITLSVKQFDLFVSWIVLYKKKKTTFISDIGERDIVFHSIISFINDVDK